MIQPEDIVRSGPNQFISQKGIYHELDSLVSAFQSPAVVTGYDSYQAFSQYTKLPPEWPVIQHKGYSSPNAVTWIAEELNGSDVIIGIGGGTILDTAKSVADALQIEVIMVPTIPGTCAASTPLSVIYDEKGNFMRVDYHKRSSYLTVIDHTFCFPLLFPTFKAALVIRWQNGMKRKRLFVTQKAPCRSWCMLH